MLHKGSHYENIGTLQFEEGSVAHQDCPVPSINCFRQYLSKSFGLRPHHCVTILFLYFLSLSKKNKKEVIELQITCQYISGRGGFCHQPTLIRATTSLANCK